MIYTIDLGDRKIFIKQEYDYIIDRKILGRLMKDRPNTSGLKFKQFAYLADLNNQPNWFKELDEILGNIKDLSTIKESKSFYGIF